MRWILALVLVPLAGCIAVDISGIEGFSGQSASWVIAADGSLRSHSFHLSDAADYCSKLQAAEQERISATARHQTRQDDGVGLCESTDAWHDDLRDAFASLDYDGARLLTLVLDHGEELSGESRTGPRAGSYVQRGGGGDGRFTGDLVYRNGSSTGELADAYACEDPDTVDLEMLNQFLESEQVDLVDRWTLDSGELTLSEGGDDAWEILVDADLLDGGSNSVGTLSTSFTASRCDVTTSN